ncbi:YiiX/YebB-like N1pC/P60 family cysteine hydrolase [Bdellovibrio reynosensis]|uniref:YiiX family permuted papain-like enzyme n=1 Tax=Bdellovibrio reynosensis TaxID=2835041 RepID=A0ABY4CF85_9BACT|nr:YiiX/YebB-like N1pC/P60 family cysteine hydrolase [Bdellovibrio reynosensis]UOF02203.1 hypothetical protein MNR06_04470 [Bdellovibrio reynosensis]
MKTSALSMLFLSFLFSFSSFAATYQDGDIIFHESQGVQSKAIQEATGSKWTHVGMLFYKEGQWQVAEAVQPVRFTSLSSFISRGKNKAYRIYRVPGLTSENRKDLRLQLAPFVGADYDIYFEWTDDLIYCSELVYKVFKKATGIEVGHVQKFRDLNLGGPYVKALIKNRLENTGRELDLNEPIITPVAQIKDAKLKLVEEVK